MLSFTSIDIGIFFVGAIVSSFTGVVGNLFVTCHLRKTDGDLSRSNTNLYLVSLIILIILTLLTSTSFFYFAEFM